jgi:ssDNA thymidine ADP-ribosyltransferase, DarT
MPQEPSGFDALLTPARALIFRLTHRDNLGHVLRDGLRCKTDVHASQTFVAIGLAELIQRRTARTVPIAPGGTLADYVPFYFTPCTPMALNIVTGRGVPTRRHAELLILVSSLKRLEAREIAYVVTDRHAALDSARFSAGRALVDDLPWAQWRARDFKRDPDDLEKMERYQAEALVHRHLPVSVLDGIITADTETQAVVEQQVNAAGVSVPVLVRRSWYPR